MTSFSFGATSVDLDGPYSVTTMPGGARIVAAPQDNDDYRRTALRLGYGSDTIRMCHDHDACHAWLAQALGLPESPSLRNVADGIGDTPLTWLEEDAVCAVQRYANAAGVSLSEVFSLWSKSAP